MPFSDELKRICIKDWAKAGKHNPPTIFLPHQPNPFLEFQRLLMGCANASRVQKPFVLPSSNCLIAANARENPN